MHGTRYNMNKTEKQLYITWFRLCEMSIEANVWKSCQRQEQGMFTELQLVSSLVQNKTTTTKKGTPHLGSSPVQFPRPGKLESSPSSLSG